MALGLDTESSFERFHHSRFPNFRFFGICQKKKKAEGKKGRDYGGTGHVL